MSTFQKCPNSVKELALEILCAYESHKPLLDAKVSVDYIFAHAERDEKSGEPVGVAVKHHGVQALGVCRKLGLKDRAAGRADAEILLDGDWWEGASREEQGALLDHELHHLAVKIDKRGLCRDDLSRPVLQLRQHDHQFGWFKIIAERHGQHSQERKQAREMMDGAGQYYFPGFAVSK